MIYVLSGGGGLSFRVFSGTTAPSSPKLYDIWVKTSVPMTKAWLVPKTWTTTGTGAVAILCDTTTGLPTTGTNVLVYKKDSSPAMELRMTFNGCKQLQSGVWQNLDAYIYKNSQWVQFSSAWSGELYDAGNEFTSITGGWSGYTSKTNTTMTVVGARAKTGNIITFGEYKYLNVYVTASSGDPTTPIYVGVENASGTTIASYSRACANNVTLTVELGSITSGRPVFWGGTYSGGYGESYKATLTTNKVWLSKERPT